MFCPQCGAGQSEDMKFCNKCGVNLLAVRQAVQTRESGEKVDWSKTWLAEMFLSEDEKRKRKLEYERQLGITPEHKRQNEIKGGIITSCAGIGLMIFLFVFMKGIVAGIDLPRIAVEILNRLWVVGVIPFFVGLGLVINGLFVSKKLTGSTSGHEQKSFERDRESPALRPADTTEFVPSGFSVTEGTTKHLNIPSQKTSDRNI
jgi:hypothetical protein